MQKNFPVSKILFYFWKIFGLCPFNIHKIEIIKRSEVGTLYVIFLIITFTICTVRVFITRITSNRLPLETVIVFCIDFCALFLELVINIIIWLYVIIYQNQLRLILRSLRNVIETAISLGMREMYKTIYWQIHLIVIIINIGFISVICLDLLYDHLEFIDYDFFVWISFDIPRCISLNFIIIYNYTLYVIKLLFMFINDSLKILPEVEIAHSVRKKVKTIRLSPHEVDIRLNELSQLHFDLKHLVKMFSELLSLPLLIALTMQLFHIILNTYMISIFINNGRHRSWRGIRGLTALTAFLLLRLIQLFSIVNVCDATCQEANRKAIILHEFWASRRPEGSKDRLKKISIQLLQQPMVIKLYDSIYLNHQLIHKVTGMIITYLTIMMQIDKQNHLVDDID